MLRTQTKFKMTEKYDCVDALLIELAKYCIKNNLYRQANTFYSFNRDEIKSMNDMDTCDDGATLKGGYMFLDDPNGTEGMIRLNFTNGNPKWSFWINKDGVLEVDYA